VTIYFSPGWINAFNEGQRVPVIPVASEGWVFQQWQGDADGTSNPFFLTMNSDKNIIGVFVKKGIHPGYRNHRRRNCYGDNCCKTLPEESIIQEPL
jgi:hypothetical protein